VRSPYEDTFVSWSVPGRLADQLWAGAWWFLGTTFFRQNIILWQGRPSPLLHLRVAVPRFRPNASMRRVLRRNADLVAKIRAPIVDDVRRRLFDRHKSRFTEGVPDSLDDFLGPSPGVHPVSGIEFDVYCGGELIAASYVAVGEKSVASLYGIFDPAHSRRSLGWYTLLLELEYAQRGGYRFYYPGYALANMSRMDYKKRLPALEAYEWNEGWRPYAGPNGPENFRE
jgi:leucyl-tRNA---protein transferase